MGSKSRTEPLMNQQTSRKYNGGEARANFVPNGCSIEKIAHSGTKRVPPFLAYPEVVFTSSQYYFINANVFA
jgi:hypothetical protein